MRKLYISMYHYTRDLKHSRYPNIKGLDIHLFREQIEFFKNNFNVIRMEQLIDAVKYGQELPDNAILLTFDDGYVDNYLYALPILEEKNLQGSFFIPAKTFTTHELLDVNKIHYTLASAGEKDLLEAVFERLDYYRGREFNYPSNEELFHQYAEKGRFDTKEIVFVKTLLQTVLPERLRNKIASDLFRRFVGISEEVLAHELYMNEEQIKTMKRHGMFIGIHGYDHYWLGNLEKDKMQKDILKALEIMDVYIDRNNWVMNYPYGSYNDDVVEFIQKEGACLGLTTDVGIADLSVHSRYLLPRLDCNDFPPKSDNYMTGM